MQNNMQAIHLNSNKPYPVGLPFPSAHTSAQAMENWRTLQRRIALAQKLARASWQPQAHKQALAYYCQQAYLALLQAHKLAVKERKPQA